MSWTGLIRDWVIDPIGLLFILSLLLLAIQAYKRLNLCVLLGGLVWLSTMFLFSAPRAVNPMLLYFEDQFDERPACLAERPIVLLGGGVDSRAQSAEQSQYMDQATFVRTIAAQALAQEFPEAPVLIAGGALRSVSEAAVISHFLRSGGLSEERLFQESESSNTFENARYIRSLIDQRNLDVHINLVTSALHMKRAKAAFEKQGLEVCPVAVDRHGIRNVPIYAWWPQISALQKFDLLLHELIALALYKVKGWL